MSATEIILIVIGVAVFLLGYLMPARKKDLDEEVQLISEDEVRKLIAGEVEHVKERISDIVDETVNYSIEKTERAMERVTNEKIMAVNAYSDTVLEEINKTKIGPGGLGGKVTALGLNIETYPTHIAGLPVAINICCHVNRHVKRVL